MTLANGILYERIGPCTNQAGLPGTAIGDTHTDISCASISAVVHRLRRETRRHGQRADAGVQTIRQGDRTPVTRANEEFACDVRDALGDVSCIDHGAGFGWRRTSVHARIVRGRRPPIGRGRCSGATSCRAELLIPKASMSVFLIWTNGVFIPSPPMCAPPCHSSSSFGKLRENLHAGGT